MSKLYIDDAIKIIRKNGGSVDHGLTGRVVIIEKQLNGNITYTAKIPVPNICNKDNYIYSRFSQEEYEKIDDSLELLENLEFDN
jgi:hypothetical protein